jgi:hypothetical protein
MPRLLPGLFFFCVHDSLLDITQALARRQADNSLLFHFKHSIQSKDQMITTVKITRMVVNIHEFPEDVPVPEE